MKRLLVAFTVLLLIGAAFLAGSRYGRSRSGTDNPADGRKILYYVDPMNPAHTSDQPGLAPCGMKMEPVYAESVPGHGNGQNLPPGTVSVRPEKQQLLGVRFGAAERQSFEHSLRLLGQVAVDETRLYRVNGAVDGWITEVLPVSVGSAVRSNEVLATFYSAVVVSAVQALVTAVEYQDRAKASGDENVFQRSSLGRFNLEQHRESLLDLGVSEVQIQELTQSRKNTERIRIVSPADGFIIARNASAGQRFQKGQELFRIADLDRVWILADLFEKEADLVQSNLSVRIRVPGTTNILVATVSDTLPQFDSQTRSLKLRLEADNPDYLLKPEMFVDIELPLRLPETVVVPADAVLDAGQRQTVFVDRGSGYFEPRSVQTGWRLGGRVQILHGLAPGERIVVSGNFLLDSESRMKLAAAGLHGAVSQDPVCRMAVDEVKAKAAGRVLDHQGRTYYFCNPRCREKFQADPQKYLSAAAAPPEPAASAPSASHGDSPATHTGSRD